MTARRVLARASFLCAVGALSACANNYNASRVGPVAAPAQNVALTLPTLTPAATALNRVTADLGVSVRKIKPGARPNIGLLASADIQPRTVLISSRLQCVPFARERSGVAIRGNANTWWKQAAGEFVRVKAPAVGAVIVMKTRRGHVAVVTKIVDNRTVIIDHANWLSNGQIYLDQPMMDVSANNDWSKVVIWHPTLGQFGKRALGVSGFILDASAHGNSTVYASLNDVPASLAGVQYAAATPATVPAAEPAVARAEPAPVLVASASVPANYDPNATPLAKPNSVALLGRPEVAVPATPAPTQPAAAPAQPSAPVAVAAANPVYGDTIVPHAKPSAVGGTSAPVAVASAETAPAAKPVYVDTIIPRAKPGAVGTPSAPVAIALATPPASAVEVASAAGPLYVDMVVPHAKPSQLGANAAVASNEREAASLTPASAEAAYVPMMKPAVVTGAAAASTIATFR